MRADNYALSEETKQLRDSEQTRLTDDAYEEAQRLLAKHRAALDRLAQALLEKETLVREEMNALLADVEPESRASETIGTVRALLRVLGGCHPRVVAAVQVRGIHHLGVAVTDLDEAVATYERLFGAELEHRARVDDQGVEAAAVLVGDGRVELLAPLGDETPVGRFLAKPRARACTTSPTRSTTSSAALDTLAGRGRRADRRRAAAGALRAPGRLRPSRRRPRRPHRGGVRCTNAEADSVRVELAFDGGPILSALVTVKGADELERALATEAGGTVMLDSTDGRYTIALAPVVYLKRYARESRVGFGI